MSHQRQQESQRLRQYLLNPNFPKPEALFLDAGYVLIERDPHVVARVTQAALGRAFSEEAVHAAILEAQRHFYDHVAQHGFPEKFGNAPQAIPPLLLNEYAGFLCSLLHCVREQLPSEEATRFFAAMWAVESKGELYVKMMNPRLNSILARFHAADIRLVMVSNASPLLLHMLDRAGVDVDLFDAILASEVVGYKKPQPEIFQLGLDALRLHHSRVVFIDDAPAYLDPVKSWLRCIRFDPHGILPDALPDIPVCTDLDILADVLCAT